MSPDPVRHADTIIFPASLDPQAVSVVRRLREAGYESYLVGGCVRDLLLGHIPKDFDASTEARPRQIRRVFRNCRIIGRRFKLAHVHFGSHIIEVATFRRNPTEAGEPGGGDSSDDGATSVREDDADTTQNGDSDSDADDLLITRDNVYGTSEEDTLRRDFTINALLYDVLTDEVIDYVGGVKDVENKILRTIGDPLIRIAEDPVRMLRAVKFTARLGLTMDPALEAAMRASAELIDRSAPPRVLEEIYKMLTCGAAARALELLLEYGLLERLLPELAEHWKQRPEELVRLGAALDHVDRAKRRVDNSFVLALLFHDVWRESLAGEERVDPLIAARELIAPAAQRMNIPRRDVSTATQLLLNQSRLERSRRGRRFRMAEFLARETTVSALDMMYVRCLAGFADPECHARWAMRLAEHRGSQDVPGAPSTSRAGEAEESRRPKKRRRRGGRRRSGSREGSERSESRRPDKGNDTGDPGEAQRDGQSAASEVGHEPESAKQDSAGASSDRPRRRRSRGGRNRNRNRNRTGDARSESGSGPAEAAPSGPRPESSAETAAEAHGQKAPSRQPQPSASSGDAAAPGTSPGAARSPGAPPAAGDGVTAPEPGITGRIKGLLRRVMGRPQPTASSPSAVPESVSPEPPQASGSTEAPTPAHETPANNGKSTAESASAGASDAVSQTGGPGTGDTQNDEQGGSTDRARRSRRPRRRRRGGASRSSRSSDESKQGSRSENTETKESPDGADAEGQTTGKRSSRRRKSSGSGSGGSQRKKTSRGSGRNQGGKGKPSRSKTNAAGGKKAEGKSKDDPTPDPSGRHPEDIEDMFDW